jgi:diguanylate cyclase (GGDEF)-like protein/PAS domain S-box-containing protein
LTWAPIDSLRRLAARTAPRSLVLRSTALIFALALLLGLVFALISARIVERRENARLVSQLQQLVATVENTAQIACFLHDKTLAREISAGLMKTHAVGGVRISAGGTLLYQSFRGPVAAPRGQLSKIVQLIHSPFTAHSTVGTVTLYLSREHLRTLAWSYTRFVLAILAAEVLVIAAGTALVAFVVVTEPIKRLSTELHRPRTSESPALKVPSGNEADEIGQLVTDVNGLLTDLDALVSTERTLRIQHEMSDRKLRLVLNQTEIGLFVMDTQGTLQSWNPAFVRLLALECEPHEGDIFSRLPPLRARTHQIENMLRCARLGAQSYDADLELPARAGTARSWIELSINPLGPDQLLGVVHDITERKRSVAAAEALAKRDALTGLLNRRGLDEALVRLFAGHADHGTLALLAIDLDWFKEVNDTLGHAAGDEVLSRVGRVIESAVRTGDIVARLGGDEFVTVLLGSGHVHRAGEIARDIVTRLAAPLRLQSGSCVHIGASIGVAHAHAAEDSPAALLRRADAAMYSAKQSGRGQVCFAPSGIT